MKQIGTKQFNSNDVMSLHRDMTAVKTLNETRKHIAGQNDARFISNHNELHAWRFNTWRQTFNRRKVELSVVVV